MIASPAADLSMMRISRSTTSQSCSIGLRSGDGGGRVSKVNSSSCLRWFELWCIILLEVHQKMVHWSHKEMMVSNNTQGDWCLNNAQLVLRSPKCAKKIPPTPLHHQSEPLRQAGWIFLIAYKSPQSDENEKCNKSVLCVSSRGQSQLSLSLWSLRSRWRRWCRGWRRATRWTLQTDVQPPSMTWWSSAGHWTRPDGPRSICCERSCSTSEPRSCICEEHLQRTLLCSGLTFDLDALVTETWEEEHTDVCVCVCERERVCVRVRVCVCVCVSKCLLVLTEQCLCSSNIFLFFSFFINGSFFMFVFVDLSFATRQGLCSLAPDWTEAMSWETHTHTHPSWAHVPAITHTHTLFLSPPPPPPPPTHTHRHARAHTQTRARTRAHTHTHTQTRAHAHTHTDTHTDTRARAHTQTHTQTSARAHTQTRAHARAHTHRHARARTHTHTHTDKRARTHTDTRARTHTYTHTDTRALAHTQTHTHTHTHTHRHTHHTHSRARTHTHRHTLSRSHTHTHIHTHTHTLSLTPHTYTLSRSHTHTHSHTHSLTLTHKHTLPLVDREGQSIRTITASVYFILKSI